MSTQSLIVAALLFIAVGLEGPPIGATVVDTAFRHDVKVFAAARRNPIF